MLYFLKLYIKYIRIDRAGKRGKNTRQSHMQGANMAIQNSRSIFGLPLLLVYIFGIWCLLIGFTALATMFRSNEHKYDSDDAGGR